MLEGPKMSLKVNFPSLLHKVIINPIKMQDVSENIHLLEIQELCKPQFAQVRGLGMPLLSDK